jgi:hypothetical protein
MLFLRKTLLKGIDHNAKNDLIKMTFINFKNNFGSLHKKYFQAFCKKSEHQKCHLNLSHFFVKFVYLETKVTEHIPTLTRAPRGWWRHVWGMKERTEGSLRVRLDFLEFGEF